MAQFNSDLLNFEKIKKDLIQMYHEHCGLEIPYNDDELSKAAMQVKEFLEKLSNMVVYSDGTARKLNNLEIFLALYEFVSNRIYAEQPTSHDLIGTLITNKCVCQGYSQLMKFLCETLNISFLYKHSETYDENGNYLGSHANFEVIVLDNCGFSHCLHCDPTIDSPKDGNDVLGFNALLIHDIDVNKYYHKQFYGEFYNNFLSEQNFERSILLLYEEVDPDIQMIIGKSEEEIINERFITLRNNLIELNKFFRMNIDFDALNNVQLIEAYRRMYEYYVSISQPFNSDELKQAIINVKTAEIMYENKLGYEEAREQSLLIFEQRMKKSIDLQRKNWENTDGMSLMFVEAANQTLNG